MSAAERREQLLDVTLELVAVDGFHAVTIEAVARRAGITRPVIYAHFGDLRGLFEALLERTGRRALGQLADFVPTELTEGDPRDLLLAAFRGYLEAARDDPLTWRLVLIEPEDAPKLLREYVARGREAVVAALAQVVRPGLGAGHEPPDPELAARGLVALADEGVRLMLRDPERYPVERMMAHTGWLLDRMRA